MKTLKTTLLIILTSTFVNLFSQEIPIPIIDRINQVDYIFEGKVIESNSYEVNNGKTIYTSNTIEIYKVFKGNITCGTIELICNDGAVGDREQTSSHTLNLQKGQQGVFLGKTTNKEISQIDFYSETNIEKLEATFEQQSYIKYWYDGINYQASDLWYHYDSIAEFYNFTQQITGYSYIDCGNSNLQSQNITPLKSTNSVIDSIYPLFVYGGIKDTLSFFGSGFGNVRGTGNVYFKNSDDGGQSKIYCDPIDVISWSDNVIKVLVPSRNSISDTISNKYSAGSGSIRIVTNDSTIFNSQSDITIHYSIKNYSSDKKISYLFPDNSFNQKFTFRCDTAISNYENGKMKAVIKRALLDWSCLTGVNWELGADTFGITNSFIDDVCIINFSSFSNNKVIAKTTKHTNSCSSNNYAFIYEVDLLLNKTKKWYLDTLGYSRPDTSFTDLYHVMLHEFGHAHGLNHVIDNSLIIHYSVPNSLTNRLINLSFDSSCDDGGNWMMDNTIGKLNYCNTSKHILRVYPETGCDFEPSPITTIDNATHYSIFPNPLNTKLFIKSYDESIKLIIIYNSFGNVIYKKNSKKQLTNLDFENYTSGVYFIKITNSQKMTHSYKVIKN